MINIELWKKRKKELNWSHDDLARESGVSRRTIAGIFAGDERGQNPTIETVQAIERALGLYLDDTAREEITVQEYRLLTAFRGLDDTTRELVVLLVEKIGGNNFR